MWAVTTRMTSLTGKCFYTLDPQYVILGRGLIVLQKNI